MSIEQRVQRHFNSDAGRFDAIYRTWKGIVARFVDDFWRGVVRKRLELNLQHLEPLAGKTVLDVGCGSGRFCVAFLEFVPAAGRFAGIAGQISVAGEGRLDEHLCVGAKTCLEVGIANA